MHLAKEPLVHFAVAAFIIFAAWSLVAPGEDRPQEIVVSARSVQQLALVFERTWQRPPSQEELKALVDDHVKEEIFYREALKLGLDVDDTVIRRRLRSKMEFIDESEAVLAPPSDAELEAYLSRNADRFGVDPRMEIRHVFLNRHKRGEAIASDAILMLESLQSRPSSDISELGDTTLLPQEMPLADRRQIEAVFGAELAEAVSQMPPGVWTGPIESPFGLHLFYVRQRVAGRAPRLDEVREPVLQAWLQDKREQVREERFAELLARYTVSIEKSALPGQ